MKCLIFLSIISLGHCRPQSANQNSGIDSVKISYIPFYGSARGNTLKITEAPNGTVTSEIIKTDEVKQPQLKQEISSIQRNAQTITQLQETAKKNGELNSEEQTKYNQNLDQLNISVKNLAEFQTAQVGDTESEFDGATKTDLQSWFNLKKEKFFAKQGEENKEEETGNVNEEENTDDDGVSIDLPPENAAIAEAKPVGLAIAGPGGVAASKPIATAVAGVGGLAIARPVATAIAGVSPEDAIVPIISDGYISFPQKKKEKPMKKEDKNKDTKKEENYHNIRILQPLLTTGRKAKMLIYLTLLAWAFVIPTQSQYLKSTSLLYYTPAATQYLSEGYYPYLKNPGISTQHGKAIKSVQSHNEIIFFINPESTEHHIPNAQPENLPVTSYVAPAIGIADAKWAWLLKSNVPVPSTPKNEGISENIRLTKQSEKIENIKKSSEAEALAESEIIPSINYLKKPITPSVKSGQKYYVLNQQPQLFENYQPVVPRTHQTFLQQLLAKSAIPSTQNILFLQPQDIQQSRLKFRNAIPSIQNPSGQNPIYVQNNLEEQISTSNNQPNIKPVRYHSQDLNPQNYVFLQETEQSENPARYKGDTTNEQTVPNYPQYFFGRFLPGTSDVKSQTLHQGLLQQQIPHAPIHQTHYIPVEVVPPQVPIHITHNPYENHNIPQHEFESQKLSFIHIPIDKNVAPPPYIKSVIPVPLNTKEIPVIPPQQNQHKKLDKQVLYLSASAQPNANDDTGEMNIGLIGNQSPQNTLQNQVQIGEGMPGASALDFIRYITSRQSNLDSDTVVINARSEEDNKETTDSTEEMNVEVTDEPSISRAEPSGIALAGPGGVAASDPRGTAIVGPNGLALANPQATAVAGPDAIKPADKPSTS
ncbi:uncharacterized protein CBL_05746 [Carabus blaptoides fortunei]